MIRGTTPTHIFKLTDVDVEQIDLVYVTYKQGKNIILEKTLDNGASIDVENKSIVVQLTQEDTLKFKDKNWTWLYPNVNSSDMMAKVQIRLKCLDGTALASDIMLLDVTEILKDGEI